MCKLYCYLVDYTKAFDIIWKEALNLVSITQCGNEAHISQCD